jgi:hypothetical protein
MIDRRAPLDDRSLMQFGKFKGRALSRVPLWYFKWFLDSDIRRFWPALEAYALRRCGFAPDAPAPRQKDPEWIGAEVEGDDSIPF